MDHWASFYWLLLVSILLFGLVNYIFNRRAIKRCKSQINYLHRDRDDRYKDLANLLPQLVVELNSSGSFIFINDAGLKLIEYAKPEVRNGLTIFDIIHPDDVDLFREDFYYLLEGGINKGQEFRIVTKTGKIFFVESYLKEKEDDLNQSLHGFIIDVSDRRRLEREVLSSVLETEDKERRRFAEDLHDGLGPLLSTIKLYVDQIGNIGMPASESQEIYSYTNELLDEAISNTRNIANNILPGSIVDNGIVPALNSFCNLINQSGALKLTFISSISHRFDLNIEINIYRIAIELINNSIRHANCTQIDIYLSYINGQLVLDYTDNGMGFDTQNSTDGLGMKNIQHRCISVQASYKFESQQEQGMRFSMKLDAEPVVQNNIL